MITKRCKTTIKKIIITTKRDKRLQRNALRIQRDAKTTTKKDKTNPKMTHCK